MRVLLAIFVSLLFLSCVASQAVDCKTESSKGPSPDQPCVVSFNYKGLEFNGCTNFTDPEGKLWCATRVGSDGAYVPKSGQWGYCAPGCPLHDSFFAFLGENSEISGNAVLREVDDILPETFRQCPSQEECKQTRSCTRHMKRRNDITSYSKRSNRYRVLLNTLRQSVCNNRLLGVCCPSEKVSTTPAPATAKQSNPGQCSPQRCVKKDKCQYIREKYEIVNSPRHPDKQAAVNMLKALICDGPKRKFCCPEIPPVASLPTGTIMDPSYLPRDGECGLNPGQAPSRIVGGEDTKLGDFPFTVLLGYHKRKKCFDDRGIKHLAKVTDWKCGGTLVNHWYVVTAAHCQGNRAGKFINTVRLGEWNVNRQNLQTSTNTCSFPSTAKGDCAGEVCLPDLQDFEISTRDVTVHPDYERSAYNVKNDIALIRLPRPAKLNSGVQIACLPIVARVAAKSLNLNNIQEDLVGAWPTVVGWGYTDYDPILGYDKNDKATHRVPKPKQQRLDIEVLSKEQCLVKWPKVDYQPSQMCAGGEKGKDSCKGDSGGPLYLRKVVRPSKKSSAGHTDPWYLMGLVSFGSRDCGVSDNEKPGFYTRLNYFVPWIQKQINN